MEVLNRQHLLLLRLNPLLLLGVLALATVSVPAGIVSVVVLFTGCAGIELPSEAWRPADTDGV